MSVQLWRKRAIKDELDKLSQRLESLDDQVCGLYLVRLLSPFNGHLSEQGHSLPLMIS